MKRIYILLLLSMGLLTTNTNAQTPDDFVMTFEVDNTVGLDLTVPIYVPIGGSYTIDFGDGTVLTNQNKESSHTYMSPGIYKVIISGSFHRINFGYSLAIIAHAPKLKTIEQWGTTKWSTMKYAFMGCSYLVINATDIPDLSLTTSMANMFKDAKYFNSPINNWVVSNVDDMSEIFMNASSFNQPLNNWDVSNVTKMNWAFYGATSFNQPLSNWDVSNVTNMFGMFEKAISFNQPINNWDVSKVTATNQMFSGATSFNQPLNNWNVSNVTNTNSMFWEASAFNHPLNNWNVANVLEMRRMFIESSSFNQDISAWNFNSNVLLDNLVSNSGLDENNYDRLLLKFAQLNLKNKTFTAIGMEYCDSGVHAYLINSLNWNITGDVLGSNCIGNNISGTLYYDENANGCANNDIPISNFLIKASHINGIVTSSVFPNNLGQYALNFYAGNYKVEPVNVPGYFSATPASSIVTFTGSGGSQTIDFCLTANQTTEDLNITVIPISEARPGFDAKYQMVVQNMGTKTVANAFVRLVFDDTKQTFVSASPNPVSTTANQLTFNIITLKPLESSVINFTMKTLTPPTINGGDTLNFMATVTPDVNDNTPFNNNFVLNQTVVNAYDPNDKQVLQGNEIDITQIDKYLHYLIRFQNTGTASAINIRLEDVLDSTLDWNTLHIIHASDKYRTRITDGNQLEFIFENINLPHEAQDSAGSHGFIAYKIKPKTNTMVGDTIIGNKVNIYFDYNLPIITNSVSTKVIQDTSTGGISQFDFNKFISVYPNPSDDILYINSDNNILLKSVKIYSVDGKELVYQKEDLMSINIKKLNPGIYIVRVETNLGIINKKIIRIH